MLMSLLARCKAWHNTRKARRAPCASTFDANYQAFDEGAFRALQAWAAARGAL